MPDDNDETGFEGLDGILDDDVDTEDVETPTEEEIEELSPVELEKKYGQVAHFYVGEDE